jgi:hypothetical protein
MEIKGEAAQPAWKVQAWVGGGERVTVKTNLKEKCYENVSCINIVMEGL